MGFLPQLRLLPPVNGVAQYGMPNVGHVYPDLMCAAGFQVAADVGIAPVPGDGLLVGHGLFTPVSDGHALPVGGMSPNGGVYGAPVLLQVAANHGLVGPGQGVIF